MARNKCSERIETAVKIGPTCDGLKLVSNQRTIHNISLPMNFRY